MLLCNFRARPMSPFVGEISRDSNQKGGGLVVRTGVLDGWQRRIGRMSASAPVRQPTGSPSPIAEEAAARCPPDRHRSTPEIGESPGAAPDCRPTKLGLEAPCSMAVDFQSRSGLDRLWSSSAVPGAYFS